MGFKFIAHPADTGIEIEAGNLAELFELAAKGFYATIFEKPEEAEISEEKEIKIEGQDIKELMVGFLTELLILIDSERFIAKEIEFKKVDEKNIEAKLKGGKIDLEKMIFITEIKAITYHQMVIEKRGEGWFGRIIFDI